MKLPSMISHPVESVVDLMREPLAAQVKIDGTRLAIAYNDYCEPSVAYTRSGLEVEVPELKLPKMPPGTVIDGELVGTVGTYVSAQATLREIFLGRVPKCMWVAFDILVDPLPVVGKGQGFEHRVEFLAGRGFPVLPIGPVAETWEKVLELGLEGMVVRDRGARIGEAGWKVKAPQVINVIVMKGKGMVLTAAGRPQVVCSALGTPDGVYRVACEGKLPSGKLRAARVIGPATGSDVSVHQLANVRS